MAVELAKGREDLLQLSRASQQVHSTQDRFIAGEDMGTWWPFAYSFAGELIDTYRSRNENNPIVTDRPLSSAAVNDCTVKPTLCSVNVRSAKSKSADLLDYISSSGADLFALTETWPNANDTAAKLEFIPPGTHDFIHHNRSGRKGGGTGLLFREKIGVTCKKIDAGEKTSFEFSEWSLSMNAFQARPSIIYRPPYSAQHPVTLKTFMDEFATYVESIILISA